MATETSYSIPVYRVSLVRDGKLTPQERYQLCNSRSAAQIIREYLGDTDRENFVVLMLDQKNKVIGINTVSTGSLTASIVHPREVFKPAIAYNDSHSDADPSVQLERKAFTRAIASNAASIICAHNHPSGDPTPSNEDRAITTRLVQAGKLLGIAVLDHIVVGDGTDNYYSFADDGRLA